MGTVANIPTAVTLANGANLTFNQGTTATLNIRISGAGSLTKAGASALTLGGPNAYLGTTTINAGTLQLTAPVPNPNMIAHYTMDGPLGPIASGSTIADVSGNGNVLTMQGNGASLVAGKYGQGLQMDGGEYPTAANTSQLSSVNSWTDSVWINVPASSLTSGNMCLMSGRWNNPSAFGFDTYLSGSSITVEIPNSAQTGWIDNQGTTSVSITPSTWTMITQTVTTNKYQLYVNGALVDTQNFSGTPQLMYPQAQGFVIGAAGTGGNFVGSMDDFYLFGSVLSASQIQTVYQNQVIYFGSALPANTPVQVASGATLDLSGVSQTIDSLANSGVSGGTVTNSGAGTATLTLAPAGSTTFSGRIQNGTGKVALVLAGPGTQVFASSNTYTGGTTIDGGILVAANANGSATGSGLVTLSGGTLASGASGSISGSVVVSSVASEIAPGGFGSIGHLTVGSLATASNLTMLNFDLTTPSGSNDLLTITGKLTLAANTAITFGVDPTTDGDYKLIGYGSLSGGTIDLELPAAPSGLTYLLSTTVNTGYIDLVVSGVAAPGDTLPAGSDPAAPEPSSFALLGVAAVGLFGYAWRRRMGRLT